MSHILSPPGASKEQSRLTEKRLMIKERPPMVLSVCLLCVALLILYAALDTSGSFRFKERPGFMHYGMLAEAFVSGQLHLKQPVDPERLGSRDPLDPSTRTRSCSMPSSGTANIISTTNPCRGFFAP